MYRIPSCSISASARVVMLLCPPQGHCPFVWEVLFSAMNSSFALWGYLVSKIKIKKNNIKKKASFIWPICIWGCGAAWLHLRPKINKFFFCILRKEEEANLLVS